MTRGIFGLVAVAAGMSVAACSADQELLPAAPNLHTVGPSTTCDFPHIKSIANKYFTGAQKKKVATLATQMSQAGAYSTTAKGKGFDIMAEIALTLPGTPARGSDLTNHLILCMFSRTSELDAYPLDWPEDFTIAVTPSQYGAYAVRGGPTDPTTAVLSRPLTAPFSGVAPLQTSTWPLMLDAIGTTNLPPNRVLLYGQPGPTSTSYVWKMVPHNADFAPLGIVGLCTEDPNAMVTEDGDLLRFEDAYFCPATSSLREGWSPFGLATRLFSPRALWAGSLNPGGLGGSTGGIRSEYGTEEIPPLSLAFLSQPLDTTVGQPIPSSPDGGIVVRGLAGTEAIPGTFITLAAEDNNGNPVVLTCSGGCTQEADASGEVNFGHPSLSKTGGYEFVATGSVTGRPGITVNQAISDRFNIRP